MRFAPRQFVSPESFGDVSARIIAPAPDESAVVLHVVNEIGVRAERRRHFISPRSLARRTTPVLGHPEILSLDDSGDEYEEHCEPKRSHGRAEEQGLEADQRPRPLAKLDLGVH
jgi:hypothetical protein